MIAGNREQETGNSERRAGLVLVGKAPQKDDVEDAAVLAGRLVVMLPQVWAVAETQADVVHHVPRAGHGAPGIGVEGRPGSRPMVEVAFYRKYSEGMLRRYLRMSMEAGRVPSLLGRELFRGNVTSYRVHSFEDVVVFCMDVEKCLAKLTPPEKDLIRRVALQEYTQAEAAAVLGFSLRHVAREYGAAIDKLTRMFLEARMLEPLKGCQ